MGSDEMLEEELWCWVGCAEVAGVEISMERWGFEGWKGTYN